jgi:hypothetical protein
VKSHVPTLRRRSIRWLLLVFGAVAVCGTAHAEFALNDLQIAGRALGFLDKPLQGEVVAAIVYSPDNPQSAREALAMKDLLGDGLRIGNVTLKPLLIPVGDLARAPAALLLLTDGVDDVGRVAAAARLRRIPCITTDLAKVRSGACAIGIRTQPKIEILVNRSAAADTHLSFSTVFRMMITEI